MVADRRTAVRAAFVVLSLLGLVAVFLLGRSTTAATSREVPPGPTQIADGITLGFADKEVGADAAAAQYLLELERAIDTLDPARVAAIARLVTTQAETQAMAARAGAAISLERSYGPPLRRAAISTQLLAYSPQAATVNVLECWIYARADEELLWALERVSLVWRSGDWRVSAIAGVAPAQHESLAQLHQQLAYPGPGDASVR